MFYRILFAVMLLAAACGHAGKEHEEEHSKEEAHNHGEEKFRYTAYSQELELFAEADPFIAGEESNVLSHFSFIPSFKPVTEGKATIRLVVNGKEFSQTLNQPVRPGIYSFDLKPDVKGKGTLDFEIVTTDGTLKISVADVTVFANDEEADVAVESQEVSSVNSTSFTKEQSWKTDFATGFPVESKFGKIIRTTAMVSPSQGNEAVVTSGTDGIVKLAASGLAPGSEVKAGQVLFTLSGTGESNISVRYAEAKSNYEKAKADYERMSELAKDRIVADKELVNARNSYENAKAVYDNLSNNFNSKGQTVKSPISGYISRMFVKNGTHLEAGQEAMIIAASNQLMLSAEVPMLYASELKNVTSANIKSNIDNKAYSLEELKGKILSYGKTAGGDNYLIPVTLEIENNGAFIPGSFVELFLKAETGSPTLSVPNTALIEEQGSFFTWVQLTPELFEKREVKIGRNDGLTTEVIQGLNHDDRIITKGAMLVKLSQATGTLDAHSGHVH